MASIVLAKVSLCVMNCQAIAADVVYRLDHGAQGDLNPNLRYCEVLGVEA